MTIRKTTHNWLIAIGLSLATITSSAYADEANDINRLIQQGHLAEAMQKSDAFLVQHPKDAQVRFLKGIIYAEQNKPNDAIAVFTRLTEDYPQLPEPYNNLAVLFASANQFDKARAALEMAIRTNPSYGTAHENLGDVYAKLASQSYDKALQLDTANNGAKVKLTLIRNLFSHSNSSIASNTSHTKPATIAAARPAAIPAAIPATPPAAPAFSMPGNAKPTPAPQVAMAASTPALVVNKPATTKADMTKGEPEPAKSSPAKLAHAKPESKTATHANNSEHDDVLKILDAWATAWSEKNTNAYLAFYSKDFQLPKGATRKTWAESRRVRIEGKGRINVKINAPKVAINGSTATVKFRQIYNSDQLKADDRKTLVLNKQSGKWQITQERAGS